MAMKPNGKSHVSSASDEKVILFRDVSLDPHETQLRFRQSIKEETTRTRSSKTEGRNEQCLARNLEFSQLIIDHQRKLRESSESLHAAEGIFRKLSMEVSVLKQEKEVLSNAEKRASDEVSVLSQRVYCLQATLDTIQSTEEVREEARAAERRKQEEHIKQLEKEWAEAKRELEEEASFWK